jgi:hypothetical protein
MFLVFDHPNLTSSGGATYDCIYVAPGLVSLGGSNKYLFTPADPEPHARRKVEAIGGITEHFLISLIE